MTEEQRNARAAARNSNARSQLIPRGDLPETATRRPPARDVVERSNSPILDDDDDESKRTIRPSLEHLVRFFLFLQRV